MTDKILKPCPFCFSKALVHDGGYVGCANEMCIHKVRMYPHHWNERPSDEKLKTAIGRLLSAIAISYDEAFSRKIVNARFREVERDVQKILGIDKPKK